MAGLTNITINLSGVSGSQSLGYVLMSLDNPGSVNTLGLTSHDDNTGQNHYCHKLSFDGNNNLQAQICKTTNGTRTVLQSSNLAFVTGQPIVLSVVETLGSGGLSFTMTVSQNGSQTASISAVDASPLPSTGTSVLARANGAVVAQAPFICPELYWMGNPGSDYSATPPSAVSITVTTSGNTDTIACTQPTAGTHPIALLLLYVDGAPIPARGQFFGSSPVTFTYPKGSHTYVVRAVDSTIDPNLSSNYSPASNSATGG